MSVTANRALTGLVKRTRGWNKPVVPGKGEGTSKINGTHLDRQTLCERKYTLARVCK